MVIGCENMTYAVDKTYFQELVDQDPQAVCGRIPDCRYEPADRCYVLPVWNQACRIRPNEQEIACAGDGSPEPHALFYFFIIYYLLRATQTDVSGQWISEKDMPGGAAFFRGPHKIPDRLMSRRFGNNIDEFRERCRRLRGTSLDMGDAAFRFEITPDIPVAVVYWAGDEEFPAEAKVLYDQSLSGRFPLDVIFSMAVEVCIRVAEGGTI